MFGISKVWEIRAEPVSSDSKGSPGWKPPPLLALQEEHLHTSFHRRGKLCVELSWFLQCLSVCTRPFFSLHQAYMVPGALTRSPTTSSQPACRSIAPSSLLTSTAHPVSVTDSSCESANLIKRYHYPRFITASSESHNLFPF